MDCQDVARGELAEEYLRGRLVGARQDEFEVHILGCEECLRTLEALQAVRESLSAREHEIRAPLFSGYGLRWSWIAVAAMVVIVGAIATLPFLEHFHAPSASREASSDAKVIRSIPADTQASASPLNLPSHSSASPKPSATLSARPQHRDSIAKQAPSPASASSETPVSKLSPPTDASVGTPAPPIGSTGNNETASSNQAGNNPPASGQYSSTGQLDNMIAQLAVVRALPYTFAGVAKSQPSAGGSTRTRSAHSSAVSGVGDQAPKAGTTGYSTAQDYFRDGMSAYVERDYAAAADLLKQAVALDSELPEANLYLGICQLLKGDAKDAVVPLQSVSREKKPTVAQAAHFYLGKAHLQLRRLDDAENEFQAAAAIPGRLTSESNVILQRLQSIRSTQGNNR